MTAAASQPLALLPDAAFLEIKRQVVARTGHAYYEDKDSLLWERLLRRMRATGARDSAAYLARLSDPALGAAEWAALESQITIGETYFFRYAEQFDALARTILPELIERHAASRQLRIWSAGCSTGAEPYSIAILLHRLLGEALPGWRLSILGTDLNAEALAVAREGRYGDWALRSLPPEERERDFLPGPDGRSWRLRPQYRGMVRFERQNLLSLLDGSAPLGLSEFDLILCRNVLIYFRHEVVERLVRALGDRLGPQGWMLVGHAEPNPAFAAHLTPVSLPGTVAYRRGVAAAAVAIPDVAEPPAPPAPLVRPPSPERRVARAARRAASEPPAEAPAVPVGVAEAGDTLRRVRELADRGALGEAEAAAREGLRVLPDLPALHLQQGLIARAGNRHEAAEQAFRRALYLDRDFVMAHYQLGLLLLETGRAVAGRRCIASAARIARFLPGTAPLPEGDGMTAAMLQDIARLQLHAREG
ncbi:protein-glutamate methyltransferase [Roseomonas sp. OT10]|uniref:CheR family methyltransferase n=1 Tax=Roseomonas cutis TaxID=2897332 RepID=UPI001E335C6B|nr:CheR family methyltransferase [Roseomonas sp. OT10]UFN48099.1 protein-glutamate methyltransferase [Roseomonas sp. OT10]